MPVLRLALAQINPRLGDFGGNADLILDFVARAHAAEADIVAFPEMALTGYPIEDLARRTDFLADARSTLEHVADAIARAGHGDIVVILGLPTLTHTPHTSTNPHAISHNSAVVIQHGRVLGQYHKHHLPNYSVFDEFRNFVPGTSVALVHVAGTDVGLVICEDIWHDHGPLDRLAPAQPGLVLVINGSPFARDKDDVRIPLVQRRAQALNAPMAYVNLVGGQDDLVFDGDSFIVSGSGTILARGKRFTHDLLIHDVKTAEAKPYLRNQVVGLSLIETDSVSTTTKPTLQPRTMSEIDDSLGDIWNALVLGLRDYVDKNGFPSVILGLSGGIDSAVCASLSVDAIGPERVFGVSMPSKYSSDHSQDDAHDLATRLAIDLRVEAIESMVQPVETQLLLADVAAENLQARMRGVILMSLSNAEGHLVLTTGNKTEIAVGYSTIYGDSVGGFAPLKDVPKTLVWQLARWRNAEAIRRGETPPIPENSIVKPPSAELRPGQVDQDSLPPYEILDAIVDAYVTHNRSTDDIVKLGFDRSTVERIIGLIRRSEWKRRQGAIGPKISEMAFGRDRRLPITSAL
jgi:NAD+ synthase (glutamine-hydrolysing)